MPAKLVKFAKMAFCTFVFPTTPERKMDELLGSPEDEMAWTSGHWPPGCLARDAIMARVPAGTFRHVWAVAHGGNKASRSRCLALGLCIAAALVQPLEHADTTVETLLDHDQFQQLVDEARGELGRARVSWWAKVKAGD